MKDLIEKYFAGDTSLEEEAQLLDYFHSGQVAEEFNSYTPLFQFIKKEKANSLEEGFDEKLLALLDEQPTARVVKMKRWQSPLLRAAAVGILLIGAFLLFKSAPITGAQQAINWEKYEIKDEQQAYRETVKALRLVSSKLNKASSKTIKEVAKTEAISKYLN